MEFEERTRLQIADMICGNFKAEESFFRYRDSSRLTEFFQDCNTDYEYDGSNGSTRGHWVAETLREILVQPQSNANTPPEAFSRVIRTLMDQEDAVNEGTERTYALAFLNAALAREGFEAFYAPDKQCYVRHLAANTVATALPNPHRAFSASEFKRRKQLLAYLSDASEDTLNKEVLKPRYKAPIWQLFRLIQSWLLGGLMAWLLLARPIFLRVRAGLALLP